MSCPAPRDKVIDLYFMEHRAKLVDVAAFLDRVERAAGDGRDEDFRLVAFRRAVGLLIDGKPQRAARILDLFSDQSTEPIDSAAGMKGALGAHPDSAGKAVPA